MSASSRGTDLRSAGRGVRSFSRFGDTPGASDAGDAAGVGIGPTWARTRIVSSNAPALASFDPQAPCGEFLGARTVAVGS